MAEKGGEFKLAILKKLLLKLLPIFAFITFLVILSVSTKFGPGFYFVIGLALILITLNGNSVMNEGGLDIATFLHFGITVVFGIPAGFLAVLITTLLALHLARIPTPIDFFVQKNSMKIIIQTAQLFFTTVFLWAVVSFYGTEIIFGSLALIYILAFTAGRVVKTAGLLFIARVPFMKVLGGTVIFYLINWYLIKFFGTPFLNFLQGL